MMNETKTDMGCIYLITNLTNKKRYVGKSINPTPEQRYIRHWSTSMRVKGIPKNDNSPLHKAMRKYGYEAFRVETLCVVPHSGLDNMEAYFAEVLETYTWDRPFMNPPGYNACWCGERGWLGMKHSKKSIVMMSSQKKGIPLSGLHRLNVIAASKLRRGIKMSEEFCKNLSNRMMGRKLSKKARMLISAARMGKKASPETREKMRLNHSGFWKGRHHTPESLEKMSLSQLGKVQSPEHVEKKAAALRGRKQSETQIENARNGRIVALVENGAKNVKLNAEKVLEIVKLKNDGEMQTSIAKQYGVADSVITRILTGERWGHVTGITHVKKTGPKRVKLGEDTAKKIRERYALGGISYLQIAKEYSVNQSTIANIVKGKLYPFSSQADTPTPSP